MLRREEQEVLGLTPEQVKAVVEKAVSIRGTIRSGTGTAALWLRDFGPALSELTGLQMKPGSLNVYAQEAVQLPEPVQLSPTGEFRGEPGFVSPVVLSSEALGFALRTGSNEPSEFVEVFAHTWLRKRLDLQIEELLDVALLPGRLLSD